MTVVIDARHIGRELSGVDRYLLGLLSGLARLEGAPECAVLTRPGGLPVVQEAIATNVGRIRLIPCDVPVWSPRSQLVVPRLLRRQGSRVYHRPYPHAPLLGEGIAQVLTLHDMTPTTHRQELRRSLKGSTPWIWNAWLAEQCRRAKAIVTVSDDAEAAITRLLPGTSRKLHVIHNGVEAGRAAIPEQQLRRRFGLEGRIVSYVGRHDPHKNLVALVAAFASVLQGVGGRCTLAVAGRPDKRFPEARRLSRELGLGDRVRFTGYLSEEERVGLLRASSVFVFPSRSEGFGLPPLEAMAEGVPVVALRRTSMPEILGDAALLVEDDPLRLAAAILDVLRNDGLAAELRRKGPRRAAGFTWDACARAHTALWARCSGLGARPRAAAEASASADASS